MTQDGWFKAQSPQDRSGDILISFSHHWLTRTKNTEISVILRRRVPRTFVPLKMFIYVGTPASTLVGFAHISKILDVDIEAALHLSEKSGLTQQDIREYLTGHEKVGCYQIGKIFLFNKSVPFKVLQKESGFTPPQSFVSLSKRATEWLSRMPSSPSNLRATLASRLNQEPSKK